MQVDAATRDADLVVFESGRGLVPAVIAAVIAALAAFVLLVTLVVRALLIPGLVVGLRVVSFLIDLVGSIRDVVGGALLVDTLLSGLGGAVGRRRGWGRGGASLCKCRRDADSARKREERHHHGELLRAHPASFHSRPYCGPLPTGVFSAQKLAPKTPFRGRHAKSLPKLGQILTFARDPWVPTCPRCGSSPALDHEPRRNTDPAPRDRRLAVTDPEAASGDVDIAPFQRGNRALRAAGRALR